MKSAVISIFALALAASSHGEVTITNQWLLGEEGALVAKVGSAALTGIGTTTDGSGVATGSTVAQGFTNPINITGNGNPAASNYLTAAITLANTKNWGISAWINPSVLPNGSAQSEMGYFKIGVIEIDYNSGKWMVIHQGSTADVSAVGQLPAPAIDTPFQVSYVNQNGTATLYVNGTAHVLSFARDSQTNPGLVLGANGSLKRGFNGLIDEVTVFTFAAGQFLATDLNGLHPGPPPAPTGLAATPLIRSVLLNWTASQGATDYYVYRGTETGTYATDPVGSTTSATTYTDTGVTAGVPYYYVVRATNAAGTGDPSDEVSATPSADPVNQTITFALGLEVTKTAADAPFEDPATASPSGLPVTYSVPIEEQSLATVDADTGVVTLTGVPGTAHIVADAAATAEYNAAQASQTLTIIQATTVITWPTPGPIEVGTLLSSTQLNATSGGVDGTFTYDPSSGTALDEGTHPLSVWFTPANTDKYSTPEPLTVSILVTPVGPVLINLAYQNSMNGIAFGEQRGTASQVAPLAYTGTTWNDGGNGSAAVSNLKKSDGTDSGISVSAVLRPRATGVAWGSILGGNKLASAPTGLGMGQYFANDPDMRTGFHDILTFSGLAADHSYNLCLVTGTGQAKFQYLAQTAHVIKTNTPTDWVRNDNYGLLTDCIPNASGEITIQETIPGDWAALCGWQIVDNGVTPSSDPYAAWISGIFASGATVPADKQGANDDPDNDGVSNLVEFAIGGMDPTVGNASPGTLNGRTLTFSKRLPLAAGLTYAIEESADLGLMDLWEIVTPTTDTTTEISYTLPDGPAKDFMRLKVVQGP